MTLNREQFGQQQFSDPDIEFPVEWPVAGHDLYSEDPDTIKENAELGYEGPRPVHTGTGVFVGNFASPQEREEFRTRKYYHGSQHKFEPGEMITPAAERGEDRYRGGRNRSVYMSLHSQAAAEFGMSEPYFPYKDAPNVFRMHERPGSGTGYLYEVEPERLTETHERQTNELQASRARVVRRFRATRSPEDVDPIEEGVGSHYTLREEASKPPSSEQQMKLF